MDQPRSPFSRGRRCSFLRNFWPFLRPCTQQEPQHRVCHFSLTPHSRNGSGFPTGISPIPIPNPPNFLPQDSPGSCSWNMRLSEGRDVTGSGWDSGDGTGKTHPQGFFPMDLSPLCPPPGFVGSDFPTSDPRSAFGVRPGGGNSFAGVVFPFSPLPQLFFFSAKYLREKPQGASLVNSSWTFHKITQFLSGIPQNNANFSWISHKITPFLSGIPQNAPWHLLRVPLTRMFLWAKSSRLLCRSKEISAGGWNFIISQLQQRGQKWGKTPQKWFGLLSLNIPRGGVYGMFKSNPFSLPFLGSFFPPEPKFPKQLSGNLSSWREISAWGFTWTGEFTWTAPEGRGRS